MVVSRIRQCSTGSQGGRDRCLIIKDFRLPCPDADYIGRFNLEFPRCIGVQTHCQPGESQAAMCIGIQNHKAQIVGGVLPVFIHTADRHGITAHAPAGIGDDRQTIPEFRPPESLDESHFNQFLDEIFRSLSRFDVVLIKRVHILIKATVRNGMSVGFDQNYRGRHVPELQSLPEIAGRIFGHPGAICRHLQQFIFPAPFFLLASHLPGQGSISF